MKQRISVRKYPMASTEQKFCKQGLLNIYAACTKLAFKDVNAYKKQQKKIKENPGFLPSFNYRISADAYYSAKYWLDEVFPEISWIFEQKKQESRIQIPEEEEE